ncbi:MAG: hypothetical protein ACFFAQ_14075 [Promethearchaeota archaeon]
MVKVFISHSTKDFQLVIALSIYLKTYGVEVYITERDSQYVSQEIGYWIGKKGFSDLIPFVEKSINPEAFLSGVEYIEFDPLNPTLGVANVIRYINYQIKLKKKQRIFVFSVGLGLVGLASLIFYGLYKLGKE